MVNSKRGFKTSGGRLVMASDHGGAASSASLNGDVTSTEAF